jgi:hypothetical protein
MGRVQAFSDDFNRADSGDLGSSWESGYTACDPLQIVSNTVRPTTLNVLAMESVSALPASHDQWIQARVATINATSTDRMYLFVHLAPPPDIDGYAVGIDGATDLQLYRVIAGVFTIQTSSIETVVAGDVVRLEADQRSLSVFLNDRVRIKTNNANNETYPSGRIGIGILDAGSLAHCQWDDVGGGPIIHQRPVSLRPMPFMPGVAR